MKTKLDYASVARLRMEWMTRYKTDVAESRFYKELKPLSGSNVDNVVTALIAYIKDTPAKYFSWNKFRDTWVTWLPSREATSEEAFRLVSSSPTGYSPTAGTFWTIDDIRERFGVRTATAIENIGGVRELSGMTSDNKKWIANKFAKEYDKH